MPWASSYSTDFHDITSGASGSYSAVTGYDLVTGWGSPNGAGLINALAVIPATPDFTIAANPASVSVKQGRRWDQHDHDDGFGRL